MVQKGIKDPTLQLLSLILMDFTANGDNDNNIWMVVFEFLTAPEIKVIATQIRGTID